MPVVFGLPGLLAAGAALAAWRRARRLVAGDGAGLVVVREREVAVFGAAGGQVFDLDTLERVEVMRPAGVADALPEAPHWRLHGPGPRPLDVPLAAAGADALADALTALPGIDWAGVDAALAATGPGCWPVWSRQGPRP